MKNQSQTQTYSKFDKFVEAKGLMSLALKEEVFPGAVLSIGRDGDLMYQGAFGVRTHQGSALEDLSMKPQTVFDIGSVTASLITTTLIMKLAESGILNIDDKVTRFIQGFGVYGKSSVTIRHLLTHTAGFPAYIPYYEELIKANSGARMGILTSRGARDYILSSIIRSHLKYEPGHKQVYSEVGLILLGIVVEVLSGLMLDKALQKYIVKPLELKSTSFVDLAMIKRRGLHPVTDLIAPTEECPWRKRTLCGEVHDDNAWVMGGVAGHSGVFSTVEDMHIITSELLKGYYGRSNYLSIGTVRNFWRKSEGEALGSWVLGWDTPSKENGMVDILSPQAVGINGDTGCSIWLEPERGYGITLLSNRIHPNKSNKKIYSFLPQLHSAVLNAL